MHGVAISIKSRRSSGATNGNNIVVLEHCTDTRGNRVKQYGFACSRLTGYSTAQWLKRGQIIACHPLVYAIEDFVHDYPLIWIQVGNVKRLAAVVLGDDRFVGWSRSGYVDFCL